MKKELEEAILHSFLVREKAAELQMEKGTIDTGMRSQVTSGKHLDRLIQAIVRDLEKCGMSAEDIFCKNKGTELPGWFRATKKWDIVGLNEGQLVMAIELKSICGSYGNNLNNRAEEAIGGAIDARFAVERELINRSIPPIFGYVLIVKKEDLSMVKCTNPREPHFKADSEFYERSYIERFMIMCRRLSREGLYGAVWFVVADPSEGTVEEPDQDLSYDRFIAEVTGKIKAFSVGAKKKAHR